MLPGSWAHRHGHAQGRTGPHGAARGCTAGDPTLRLIWLNNKLIWALRPALQEHNFGPQTTKHDHKKSTRKSTILDHNLPNTPTKKAPERAQFWTTIYQTRPQKKHQKEHNFRPQATKHDHNFHAVFTIFCLQVWHLI